MGLSLSCLRSCLGIQVSRRAFLTAVAGAGAATLARPRPAAAQLERIFPPAPPVVSPIKGAIDFHVHSAPDVFGRAFTDEEVAQLATTNQMGGIVLKNHVFETASRAYIARLRAHGVNIFGGVVLNGSVGGINVNAVQWMRRMQGLYGKVVWLPTIDADHHVKFFKEAPEGIKVVEGGKPTKAVMDVMKACADNDLVFCTGHSGADECLIMADKARDVGLKKFVVTHAMFSVVDMSIEQMKQAGQLGAKLELAYLAFLMGPTAHMPWMTHWKRVGADACAKAVKEVGPEHFILSSDLGQTGNPSHPDGYKALAQGLEKEGVSKSAVDMMARTNPSRLLGLTS